MAYKIAVGSSDGINVDLKFGAAEEVLIYEVEGTEYKVSETRRVKTSDEPPAPAADCGSGSCGSGCGGNGHGCSGGAEIEGKTDLLSDCRCIVFAKIGFQAQKHLERKRISSFDVSCTIEEALQKITAYYAKLDDRKKGLV